MILKINSSAKNEFIEVTALIRNTIHENKWRNGILFLNVLHTTAALTINENADDDGHPYDGSIVNMGMKDEVGNICYILGIQKAISAAIGR